MMNSALNPEAPEFFPSLTSVTQDGYSSLNKSISYSRLMPSGISYQHFKTFPDFNVVNHQLGKNVVVQSNLILTSEMPKRNLKCFDNETNKEKIVDCNDSFLDRVNIHLDMVAGTRPIEPMDGVSVWTKKTLTRLPIVPNIQYCANTLIGAKNIPRPQLTFKDTIDNSENLWLPKITYKPHSIKPLALTMVYDVDGKPMGYEHPYTVELELYNPPEKFLTMNDEPVMPPPLEETPLTFVETEAQVDQLIEHLYTVDEIAVDLEHHSYRTYQGITCLMQISTDTGGDFLVDTLLVREHMHKFNEIFTDPKKLKVFHGAESDILWLQRDFGVYVVGMFDTHQAARTLGRLPGYSLKHLLIHYCNFHTDKTFQLADWRIRPLLDELVAYARSDTHFLLYVARCMRRELLAGRPALLTTVFEKSTRICSKTYEKEVVDDRSHIPIYDRSRKSFNFRQMTGLKILYKWRDVHARELDESPSYLIPNYMLLALAEALPRDLQGVEACCKPMPPFVKQNIITIHRMLITCREMNLEPQLFQVPEAISSMMNLLPMLSYEVHDESCLPDYRDEFDINLDACLDLALEPFEFRPDVTAIENEPNAEYHFDLNTDVKMFIPPFDRYKKYRCLAQVEELREYREKEAKLKALNKGNDLFQPELWKMQAKAQVANSVDNVKDEKALAKKDDNKLSEVKELNRESSKKSEGKKDTRKVELTTSENSNVKEQAKTSDTNTQRKRKIPPEASVTIEDDCKESAKSNQKNSIYKNCNYKKFFDDSGETRKQNKMKLKKQK